MCSRLSSPVRAKTSRAMSKASVALPMPRGPCSRMPPGSRAASRAVITVARGASCPTTSMRVSGGRARGGGGGDAARDIVAGDRKEGFAQPPVPVEIFLLEAVAGVGEYCLGLAFEHAAEGGLRVHVEQDGQVRLVAVEGELLERVDQFLVVVVGV